MKNINYVLYYNLNPHGTLSLDVMYLSKTKELNACTDIMYFAIFHFVYEFKTIMTLIVSLNMYLHSIYFLLIKCLRNRPVSGEMNDKMFECN